MVNNVVLQGRLTRDPDIRRTRNDTPVASYTLAIDRGYKSAEGGDQTDFIPCVAWDKRATFAQEYLHKGMQIAVTGQIQSRRWVTDDGKNRTSIEVIVSAHHFCEPKRSGEYPPHPADATATPAAQPARQSEPHNDFYDIDDGYVPF